MLCLLTKFIANYTNSVQFAPKNPANNAKFAPCIHPIYFVFRNSSESSRICSIHPQILRMMQNLHNLFTHYILCFRCLTSGGELSEIPANQARFAPFTHKSHELCEICTKIHPHLVHYFQNHRQRTPGNWSESTRFCAVRPQLPQIMRNSLNPHPSTI